MPDVGCCTDRGVSFRVSIIVLANGVMGTFPI